MVVVTDAVLSDWFVSGGFCEAMCAELSIGSSQEGFRPFTNTVYETEADAPGFSVLM
jgi:hypothetical protein